MLAYDHEIGYLKKQIEKLYSPQEIYVFGSCAKGIARNNSDIDLCIIMETANKRQVVRQMLIELDYDRDIDIVIYTPKEWGKYHMDTATFAHLIYRTGVKISV